MHYLTLSGRNLFIYVQKMLLYRSLESLRTVSSIKVSKHFLTKSQDKDRNNNGQFLPEKLQSIGPDLFWLENKV